MSLVIIVGYPVISILALFSVKKRKLSGLVSGIWALIILVIPFLGALAIWIVNPEREIVESLKDKAEKNNILFNYEQ